MLELITDMDAITLLLAGVVIGIVTTFIMGFSTHMITHGHRKKRQEERETISKGIARQVGTLNNIFFTYRLGDTEFGVMERECRELLGTIEEEIQQNSQVLDAGYVALVSHYAENKRDQLVGIRHDLDLSRQRDSAATAQPTQQTVAMPTVAQVAAPVQPIAAPAQPVMQSSAAPLFQETPVAPQTPQPMIEQVAQPATPQPVLSSSTGSAGSNEISLDFADFASAMKAEPLAAVAHDDSASTSDSWRLPATADTPPIAPIAPVAQVAPPVPQAAPMSQSIQAQSAYIGAQTTPQDVEATQEFSLHDIMQQGVQQQQQAPEEGGMINGDDVANKLDSLFG